MQECGAHPATFREIITPINAWLHGLLTGVVQHLEPLDPPPPDDAEDDEGEEDADGADGARDEAVREGEAAASVPAAPTSGPESRAKT